MSAHRIEVKADSTSTALPPNPNPGHSTGPRTEDGKLRAALNAYRHGLSMPSSRPIRFFANEDPADHTRLMIEFNQQFIPLTAAERELVREIVDALWLARRARSLQTDLFGQASLAALSLYLRYETAHLRAHHAAIKTLLAAQKDRRQRNEHHEKWHEPDCTTEQSTIVCTSSRKPAQPETPVAATTSTAPNAGDTSFRNPPSQPQSVSASNPPTPSQTVGNSTAKEARTAA
jgi:hypothetical protein